MSFKKYATTKIEAQGVFEVPLDVTNKQAQNFAKSKSLPSWYVPLPGSLLITVRAISNRCNDNGDAFSASQLYGTWKDLSPHNDKYGYLTFIGKNVYLDHNNSPFDDPRGVIIHSAIYDENKGPGWVPPMEHTAYEGRDVWVKLWKEIDGKKYPRTASAIKAGLISRSSMGVDVDESRCSICGNAATTRMDYCDHIKFDKMSKLYTLQNGMQSLAYEDNYGLDFFEDSMLTVVQADPTAGTLEILAEKSDAVNYGRLSGESLSDWKERRSDIVKQAYASAFAFNRIAGDFPFKKKKDEDNEEEKEQDDTENVDKNVEVEDGQPSDKEKSEDDVQDDLSDKQKTEQGIKPDLEEDQKSVEQETADDQVGDQPEEQNRLGTEDENVNPEEQSQDQSAQYVGDENVPATEGPVYEGDDEVGIASPEIELSGPPEEPTAMSDLKQPFTCPANTKSVNPEQCTGCMYNGTTGQIVYCRFPEAKNPDGKDPTVVFESPNSLAFKRVDGASFKDLEWSMEDQTNGLRFDIYGCGKGPRLIVVSSGDMKAYYGTFDGPIKPKKLAKELKRPDAVEHIKKQLREQAYRSRVVAIGQIAEGKLASRPIGGDKMTLVNNRKMAARRPVPQFRAYSSFAAGTPVLIREVAGARKLAGRGVVVIDPKLGAIVRNSKNPNEYVHVQGNKVFQKQPNGSMRLVGEISMAPVLNATSRMRRRADETEVENKGMVPHETPEQDPEEVADEAAESEPSMEDAGVDGDPENKTTATAAMHERMVAAYQLADLKAKLGRIPTNQVIKEATVIEKTKSIREIRAQIEALRDVASVPTNPMVPRRAVAAVATPAMPKLASQEVGDDLVLASIGHDRDLQALGF